MKEDNELLRAQMKKEQKDVEASKFKLIEKKQPFLPNLKQKELFKRHTTLELGVQYMDGHLKSKLTFPERSSPKHDDLMKGWKQTKDSRNFFKYEVGQEMD